MWYDANIMGHIVFPDQPGPDAGIMDWSRYLSELEKLPQDDDGVRAAIQEFVPNTSHATSPST